MGVMDVGCVIGYTSPTAPQLLSEGDREGVLQLSPGQYSWFSSLFNLGAMAGCILAAFSTRTIGGRRTMMAAALLSICGWLLIALGWAPWVLMCGRVVTGVSVGVVTAAAPPYIAEVASPTIRGLLGSWVQIMLTVGILYTFAVGSGVTWRTLAWLCVLPRLLHLVLLFFSKDLPSYLVAQGRIREAEEAVRYFRGKKYNILSEVETLQRVQKDVRWHKTSLKDLGASHVLRPFLLCLALVFFMQFSGVPAVVLNMSTVFKTSGSGMSDDASSVVVAVVQVVATVAGAVLIDKVGRRCLLIISSSAMMFSIVSLGAYYYLVAADVRVEGALRWLPLISINVFLSAFSIGMGCVPWVVIGEVFLPEVREVLSGAVTSFNWFCAFVITFIFLPLREGVGDHGVYWVFGSINLATLVFSVLLLPETKGKTLQEIAALFGRPA